MSKTLISEQKRRKTGSLSIFEQDYIIENCSRMQINDMAEALNRKAEPIIKFIKSRGLNSVSVDDIDTFNDEYDEIHRKLQKSPMFAELKYQFDEDEIKYFVNHWVDLVMQFKGDILASEYMQIKELITLEILQNRIMRKRFSAKSDIERLQDMINEAYSLPPEDRNAADLSLWETNLALAKTAESNLTNEQQKISQDKKKLFTDLKATRDQRFSKIETGDKTFATLIKSLYEEEERRKQGEAAELIRLATEKKKKELMEIHIYGDKIADYPLLTPETVENINPEEIQETQEIKGELNEVQNQAEQTREGESISN